MISSATRAWSDVRFGTIRMWESQLTFRSTQLVSFRKALHNRVWVRVSVVRLEQLWFDKYYKSSRTGLFMWNLTEEKPAWGIDYQYSNVISCDLTRNASSGAFEYGCSHLKPFLSSSHCILWAPTCAHCTLCFLLRVCYLSTNTRNVCYLRRFMCVCTVDNIYNSWSEVVSAIARFSTIVLPNSSFRTTFSVKKLCLCTLAACSPAPARMSQSPV